MVCFLKSLFQRRARPSGDISAGACDYAVYSVDLSGGRDAYAGQIVRAESRFCKKRVRSFQYRCKDRRLVVIERYRVLSAVQNGSFLDRKSVV